MNAFYKLSRKIDFRKLKPKFANRLFDSYILPILTYASEIWSLYVPSSFEKCDKNDIEKAHLRFCRYYLGVNNKSSNIACRAEIGRFPLKISIDKLAIKYFNHLICLPDDSFAKQSLFTSNILSQKNKPSYFSSLRNMIHSYDHNFPTLSTNRILNNSIIDDLESKMKTQYFVLWKNFLSKSPKLSFYQTFKEYLLRRRTLPKHTIYF